MRHYLSLDKERKRFSRQIIILPAGDGVLGTSNGCRGIIPLPAGTLAVLEAREITDKDSKAAKNLSAAGGKTKERRRH